MRETYTSDFPRMKHRENIRPQYIMTSTAAGSDNQLTGFRNLSTLCTPFSFLVTQFSLLFCFQAEGRTAERWAKCSQSVLHGKGKSPGGNVARWVWFVHPSHTSEGVTCITAPLRESLCHVYCHVPRYAAWLQTHQTHLQEYRYWECHGDPHERVQTYSSKHTCPQLCYERSQTAQKSKSTFKNAVLCINK